MAKNTSYMSEFMSRGVGLGFPLKYELALLYA